MATVYSRLTPEQKKARNKRTWERKKARHAADPALKRAYQESRTDWARAFPLAQILAFRELQRGLCAICSRTLEIGVRGPRGEVADHDHVTGKPRGLLCGACNISLGYYEKHQRGWIVLAPYEDYLVR